MKTETEVVAEMRRIAKTMSDAEVTLKYFAVDSLQRSQRQIAQESLESLSLARQSLEKLLEELPPPD